MKLVEVHYSDHEREKYLKNHDAQDPKLLVQGLARLVNNPNMTDAKFREYVRNILPSFQEEFDVEEINIM